MASAFLRRTLRLFAALTLFVPGFTAHASHRLADERLASVSVVMLSDIHFDPLHDTAKVAQLDKAPVEQWAAILESPASVDAEDRFAAVQKTCKSKEAADTPFALLRSSLAASRINAPGAAFVAVSGDLLVHDLDCRYRAALGLPVNTNDDQTASAEFAEKTTVFVMEQVEAQFSGTPVFFALGNNDSRCSHNRLDPHDEYLKASSAALLRGLRGIRANEKALAQKTFESAGYYAVTLGAPMRRTRLIVLDDIYMMPKYADCEGNPNDHTGEQEQTAWLRRELESARRMKQHVWILGHLPPAVNPDSTLAGGASFCSTGAVVRFQSTENLASQMADGADVITLGLFGHTHMDDLHLLRGLRGSVPIKVVSSVTPVSGNLPSFTVGRVNPVSARLMDYTVYKASNGSGVATDWKKEYAFRDEYHEADFSPASLAELIGRLRSDDSGSSAESRAYQAHFLKSAGGKKLSSSWQGFVCSLDNVTAESYTQCVCKTP